ncbi:MULTISPECIES: signal peptidase I [Okeania]|uniref:Signal peptidase I n=1 Tax=Okeania hirsuta TaxID=1458930 RepID=A0A3N6QPS1_9CYAN|nr:MULTISPECIES: signal peptidase I [Okeania]NEP05840.1 signal peptidase I [Okeania sp. SIO4D6]NEP71188.1 signal peptidase I [Okeania sp. SIO2G5]NEP92102.1 signal peptidase I [Okeania sp. SIO2F5]NEQ90857.1 signal peptidase I [Okeania sp. SIO2G4]NES89556.1 signal peptidase I [Okeania sp. SIO2B9]
MTSEKESLNQPITANSITPWWLKIWQQQKENIKVLAIALSLSLLVRILIAEPRYIPSDSMIPTLEVGDRLVVEKVSYYFHPPVRGDIIVFQPPQQLQRYGYAKNQAFIKRVIGLPGDTIKIENGLVYINDQPLTENYIAEPPEYTLPISIKVPENQYFVMGDNRNNSNDSHVWGFLPKKNIIGRAIIRFWPYQRLGALNPK